MAAPLQYTVVDSEMRPRVSNYTDQSSAIAAGEAAIALVDDVAWAVVQVLPGRGLDTENYDSLLDDTGIQSGFFYPPLNQVVPTNFDRSFFPIPTRFLKLGEIKWDPIGKVAVFTAITPPDGHKRSDP